MFFHSLCNVLFRRLEENAQGREGMAVVPHAPLSATTLPHYKYNFVFCNATEEWKMIKYLANHKTPAGACRTLIDSETAVGALQQQYSTAPAPFPLFSRFHEISTCAVAIRPATTV